MSAPADAATLQRRYNVHGVGVEVVAADVATQSAVDLRLRAFGIGDAAERADVRLEFVIGPAEGARGGRPVYDTRHGSLRYDQAEDELSGIFGGVSLHCTPGRGVATLRTPRFAGQDLYIATHPLMTISLMELLEHHGLFSLHAACLTGESGRGVLLAGPSGAGKSTLSLALAHSGMPFVSDDVLFLAPREDAAPRVLGFADAIGFSEKALTAYPRLAACVQVSSVAGFPKRLGRIEELFGRAPLPACDPAAIVFPEVDAQARSDIRPMDPADAWLRLVPDVLVTEPSATQAHLRAIAALVEAVPCFTLRSGADLARAAELVGALV